MSSWNDLTLIDLFKKKIPLIDVRAPVEFAEGYIPHSVNLPILNDEERARVGTTYKEHGQEAAIKLGHELVSGKVKEERISAWRDFIQLNPEAQVFCFRGGLRSQTSCEWLKESGLEKKPLTGGYKRLRNFFLSWLNEGPMPELVRLGGPTGSGKSKLLNCVRHIDLEGLANHRGSAFGYVGPQPTQITFENALALEILNFSQQKILVEDESATIGKLVLPKGFFLHLREAPLVILKIDKDERVQNIFNSYVKDTELGHFEAGLERIKKSLGGVRYEQIREELLEAFSSTRTWENHQSWISSLLDHYYDPIYLRDIERQREKVIFEGNTEEVRGFLQQLL